MQNNDGIIATGDSNVVGNAIASGTNATAEVGDNRLTQTGHRERRPSPQDIDDLLSRLIDELRRSDHPDRADLIEATEDAREELASAQPRRGKLKLFAKGLVDAVVAFAALASLAVAIEQAISGL